MRTFWKVFIVSFLCFSIAIVLGSYSYIKINQNSLNMDIGGGEYRSLKDIESPYKEKERTYASLKEAFQESNRINTILLGMEDVRTDTLMLISFNPKFKKVDMISIPRDTYIHRKGHDLAEQRKINAIYGEHGIDGVKKAISHILEGIPIHHYVMVDYDGVKNIVDYIGGVEVMVPFPMRYKDSTSKPPLNIDIKQGKQILDGKNALDFLRYRKGNNRQGYIDGDLGRIKAQQEFIKSFINKTLSYRLPVVVQKGIKYVKTDIGLMEGLAYSKNAIGIRDEDCTLNILPGKGEFKKFSGKLLSYFFYDVPKTKNLLESIYNVKTPKS